MFEHERAECLRALQEANHNLDAIAIAGAIPAKDVAKCRGAVAKKIAWVQSAKPLARWFIKEVRQLASVLAKIKAGHKLPPLGSQNRRRRQAPKRERAAFLTDPTLLPKAPPGRSA
jgi:hypothetical protein